MPMVLEQDGFRIVIYLPPREHGPPHVHVWKAGKEVVVDLALPGGSPRIRDITGMRASDVTKAFRIVETHSEFLLGSWRTHHG